VHDCDARRRQRTESNIVCSQTCQAKSATK
jgi:hypothetical protein